MARLTPPSSSDSVMTLAHVRHLDRRVRRAKTLVETMRARMELLRRTPVFQTSQHSLQLAEEFLGVLESLRAHWRTRYYRQVAREAARIPRKLN